MSTFNYAFPDAEKFSRSFRSSYSYVTPELSPACYGNAMKLMKSISQCTTTPLTLSEIEKILNVRDRCLRAPNQTTRKIGAKDASIARPLLISEKGDVILAMTQTWAKGDKTLDQGFCKTIKLGVDLKTVKIKIVAVARLYRRKHHAKISNHITWARLPKERAFLELFRNEREFVQLDFVVDTGKKVYFVMEYCNQSDIYYLSRTTPTEKNLLYLIRDYLTALVKMHAKKVVHRDIKTENLFAHQETPGAPFSGKIGDMGDACFEGDESSKKEFLCTERSCAPEYAALRLVKYKSLKESEDAHCKATTPKVDIFSMGCVIYVMFCGGGVFNFQKSYASIAHMNEQQALREINHWLSRYDGKLQELIYNMIRRDPLERWTAEQALDHFNKYIFIE